MSHANMEMPGPSLTVVVKQKFGSVAMEDITTEVVPIG